MARVSDNDKTCATFILWNIHLLLLSKHSINVLTRLTRQHLIWFWWNSAIGRVPNLIKRPAQVADSKCIVTCRQKTTSTGFVELNKTEPWWTGSINHRPVFFFRRATNGLNGAISHFGSAGHQTPSIQKAYLIYRPCFASRNIDPLGCTHFHGTKDWVFNGSLASLQSSQRRISVQRPIAPGRACQTILRPAQLFELQWWPHVLDDLIISVFFTPE